MNYNNPEMIDMLAAEYVLGTLQGQARARFKRLIVTLPEAREAVTMWEGHLNGLAANLKPVQVNARVWEKISARIDDKAQVVPFPDTPKVTGKGWQWFSAAATAACVLLAVLLWQPWQHVPEPVASQVALFQSEEKAALWFIDVQGDHLSVKASQQLQARNDKDYELWMIIKGQDAPISLGILPKSGEKRLPVHAQFNADNINLLAVSLEPLGGSPTGAPTEVLYTTELVVL